MSDVLGNCDEEQQKRLLGKKREALLGHALVDLSPHGQTENWTVRCYNPRPEDKKAVQLLRESFVQHGVRRYSYPIRVALHKNSVKLESLASDPADIAQLPRLDLTGCGSQPIIIAGQHRRTAVRQEIEDATRQKNIIAEMLARESHDHGSMDDGLNEASGDQESLNASLEALDMRLQEWPWWLVEVYNQGMKVV
jgi:hypothetical protein